MYVIYMYTYMYIYVYNLIPVIKKQFKNQIHNSYICMSPKADRTFLIFQNGSVRTHLGQKRQINNTINSNLSISNKSEAARVRKRYI